MSVQMSSQLLHEGQVTYFLCLDAMPVCVSSRLFRRVVFRKELLVERGKVTIVFTSSVLRSQPLHLGVVGMLWSSQLLDLSCSWRNKKYLKLASFMRKFLNVIFAHL